LNKNVKFYYISDEKNEIDFNFNSMNKSEY